MSGRPPIEVLIDAENVRRSQWPNVPAARLVELCRAWAAGSGRAAVVVFDGQAPAALEDGSCMVVGTGSETADEWIARRAAENRAAGREYWLVTSDRALRETAGEGAGRIVGGGAFLRELAGSPGV